MQDGLSLFSDASTAKGCVALSIVRPVLFNNARRDRGTDQVCDLRDEEANDETQKHTAAATAGEEDAATS